MSSEVLHSKPKRCCGDISTLKKWLKEMYYGKKFWAVDELVKECEMRSGVLQGDKVSDFKDYTKKPRIFHTQESRVNQNVVALKELKKFFAELTHPTQESLAYVKEALLQDDELRYAVDKENRIVLL